MPPVSLAPILIMVFVCLAFFVGCGLVCGFHSFVLNLSIFTAKKALQRASRLEFHPKPGGKVGREEQFSAG